MRFFTLSQALVFTLCTTFLTGAYTTRAHEPSHLRRHAPFPAPARIPEPIALAPAKIWDFYFAHAGAPPPSPPTCTLRFHGDAPPAGHFPGAVRSDGPRPAHPTNSPLTSPSDHVARVSAAAGAAHDAAAAAVAHDTVPGLPRRPPSSPGSGSTPPATHGGRFVQWLHQLRRLRSRFHHGPLSPAAPTPSPSWPQRQFHSTPPPPPHSPTPPPLRRVSPDAHGPAPTPSFTSMTAANLTLPSPPFLGARLLGNDPPGPSLSHMLPTPGLPPTPPPWLSADSTPSPSPQSEHLPESEHGKVTPGKSRKHSHQSKSNPPFFL